MTQMYAGVPWVVLGPSQHEGVPVYAMGRACTKVKTCHAIPTRPYVLPRPRTTQNTREAGQC
jgi:hypothetical protein